MDKKNKEVVITNNPLESVTVGTIKQDKYSTIKLLLLIIVFALVIVFLPNINSFFNSLGKNNEPTPIVNPNSQNENNNTNNNEKEKNEEENDEPSIVLLPFSETNEYDYNGLHLSNILYGNGNISFNISNNKNEKVNLNSEELFLETYKDNMFVQRFKLTENIATGSNIRVSFPINKLVDSFRIIRIDEQSYGIYDKSMDEEGNSTLICSNETETIAYKFNNNKLIALDDHVSMDYNYQTYLFYYNLVNSYNVADVKGISATVERESKIEYNVSIDFRELNIDLNNQYYFHKDTNLNKVYFIMNSLLFTCE